MLKFKTEKLTEDITRIYGFGGEMMYLVEGKDRAALIDTGSGLGSLKNCIRNLTDKEVIVLLTHGHIDHAMGAGEFDHVYMNLADKPVFMEHSSVAYRALCFGIGARI